MSYPDVVSSVTALYTAGGFIQAADGTLVFSTSQYRGAWSVRPRDHSPTRANVVVGLQTL